MPRKKIRKKKKSLNLSSLDFVEAAAVAVAVAEVAHLLPVAAIPPRPRIWALSKEVVLRPFLAAVEHLQRISGGRFHPAGFKKEHTSFLDPKKKSVKQRTPQ
jgi:hypothetical protein